MLKNSKKQQRTISLYSKEKNKYKNITENLVPKKILYL